MATSRTIPVSGPRHGFTILELLVVLLVVSLLVALLLPGIQHAREAARRIQCQNNLHQIGLALHNYNDLHDCFPPGYVARGVLPRDSADTEFGPGYAWGVMLLPFLDQKWVYVSMDFTEDPIPLSLTTIGMMPFYCCPSDPKHPTSNYVGSFGYGSMTVAPGAPAGPGILYRNSHVHSFDIKDGTSHTFLVGERAALHNFVPGADPIDAGAQWLAAPSGLFRNAGLVDIPGYQEGPASYVMASVGQDQPVAVHATPCRTNFIASFSSLHPDGANFLMADGSGHFISSDIDYETYRRLGQRSDRLPAEVPVEF
jgi:prepilin-type N-terminal cleavage/methylation domain-containing protein/prepilin-type processing-associated H-X9-DG protein